MGRRVLVIEDEASVARAIQRTLERSGYEVTPATDKEGLTLAMRGAFDAIITDWLMPTINGVDLIRRLRAVLEPPPFMLVVSALSGTEARRQALECGAGAFLVKPYSPSELVQVLDNALTHGKTRDNAGPTSPKRASRVAPPFWGVFIAGSTGAPPTILNVMRAFPAAPRASFFIALHAPAWALGSLRKRLLGMTEMPVEIAAKGLRAKEGHVYIAPAGRHLTIEASTLRLVLREADEPDHFCPSADLLFTTGADVFLKRSIGVVLTGIGRDGAEGALRINAVGGTVIAQAPDSAVAPSMPETVIQSGAAHRVLEPEAISRGIRACMEGSKGVFEDSEL
ncbi:MAG: response regulator [Deltaproteobacteria bacterium]|nr:response regulator [Deltaproteobacteria bacterium]